MALTAENLKALANEAGEAVAAEARDWDSVSSVAYNELNSLSKGAFTEVRAYLKPPSLVETTMAAASIALKRSDTSWAASKTLLKEGIKPFHDFDPATIDRKMIRKLKPYIENPDFRPEMVARVSAAASSIAMWVHAVYEYGVQ